jgi:hypothetical protein
MQGAQKIIAADGLFTNPSTVDDPAKSQLDRHPSENRGPERLEIPVFRLSPE